MYEKLLAEARSLNETVNVLRDYSETSSSTYLQLGFTRAVSALCCGGFLTVDEMEELNRELSKGKEE